MGLMLQKRFDVNNKVYEKYGDQWYQADNDPVALLRAEGHFKNQWIEQKLLENKKTGVALLDIACGGGFLPNHFAKLGYECHGVDIFDSCLKTAEKYDETKSVKYRYGDAHQLPYANESFDVVCIMDFLEHTPDPQVAMNEACRVLKKDGILFFHTFNRNRLCWLVIIKLVEWLVPNTPKKLHILDYFIKPNELEKMLNKNGLVSNEMTGIRPVIFQKPLWKGMFTRIISDHFAFALTSSLLCSYMGFAQKK